MNLTREQISKKLNISLSAVKGRIKNRNIKSTQIDPETRGYLYTPEQVKEIAKLLPIGRKVKVKK